MVDCNDTTTLLVPLAPITFTLKIQDIEHASMAQVNLIFSDGCSQSSNQDVIYAMNMG